MSQNTKSAARPQLSVSPNKQQTSLLQPAFQQALVDLEIMLMLAQLNSVYYQLALNLQQTISRIQGRYFRNKMDAFLAIQYYGYSHRLSIQDLQGIAGTRRIAHDDNQSQMRNAGNLGKVCDKYQRNVDYQQIATNITVKCKQKLQNISNLLPMKNQMLISLAFLRLQQHRQQSNIYSQKSSKIETNDSQKSKLFRRSMDKKDNRKSFSLQKSGLSPKHEYYVPIKYQASKIADQFNEKTEEKHLPDNSNTSSSMLGRFLQKIGCSQQRRNNLQMNREKKQSNKHSSAQKYSSSLAKHQRQEKIIQLDYLKRKYKKLIDQFGWFSERFLKVIEQEEYMQ